METSPPPPQAADLSTGLYLHLTYTLTQLLPRPLDGSPRALGARNLAAAAKVAALLPANANEFDLAAQLVLRLLRENAHDIALVMRLNAQYGSMVRTSLSVHARLMRVQALRQKREAIEGAANQDAWTQHITEQSMLKIADRDPERPKSAPRAARVETPAAHADQTPAQNVSGARQILMDRLLRRRREDALDPESSLVREAMAHLGYSAHELTANGHENPGTAD